MTTSEDYDPLSWDVKQHAHEVFTALRPTCPVHLHRLPAVEVERQHDNYLVASPTTEFWSVFRYDDAVHVLQDPQTFSSLDGPGPERMARMSPDGMLLTADEPAHRRQRQIANKGFLPRVVNERIPVVKRVVDDLVDHLGPLGRADLMSELAFPLTVAMITDFFGVGGDRRGDIMRWGAASVAAMGGKPEEIAASGVAVLELFTFLSDEIAERRRALTAGVSLPGDVLSALITAEYEGGGFSDEEIMMAGHQFLVAGFESTAAGIGNGLYLMCAHPEERAKLEADWSLVDNAVEEVLRYESPVEGTFRTATTAVSLGGQTIPPGGKVRVVYASANRDEERFADSGRFRIDRPPRDLRGHLAFATGPHACIGAALARAELRIALETVLRRLPGYELDPERPAVRSTALVVNGFAALPVRWDPERLRPRLWDEPDSA